MARRIVYKKQHIWLIALVVIALILFIWYYLKNTGAVGGGEKCPDGRSIPSNGDCGANKIIADSTGAIIVTPVPPDSNGCITVSKYTPEAFPLTLGMKGTQVKKLQENLNKYFSAALKPDGYFGCKTLDAVIKNLGTRTVDITLFNSSTVWTLPIPGASSSPNTTG